MTQRQVRPKRHKTTPRLTDEAEPKEISADARTQTARRYLDSLLTLSWRDGTVTKAGEAARAP